MYQNSSKRSSKLQRFIAMLLCLVMVLSTVAIMSGCSGEGQNSSQNNVNVPADSTPDNSEDVQTKPVKFVVRGLNDQENKTSNEKIYQMIKEQSGVDFEVIVVPSDNFEEKVNMMVATGDDWDVLNLTNVVGDWNRYYQKNALQPWDAYLEYMPNVAARLNEDSLKGCTLPDGSIYALPRKEYFSKQHIPAIRQDWLDALNMDCPTTMDELEAYFQAVIDENLNGNDNEIPMLPFMLAELEDFRPFFMGFYGKHYLTEDGTIMPWYTHEKAYEMLARLHKWYEKGWLYTDYQTMSIQDGFDLIGADRIGGYIGPYNAGVSASMTVFDNDPDSKIRWVSLDNFTDFSDGGTTAWGINPVYQPELALNANSTNGKWAAKLLNWMFENEDNYMLVVRGIQGETWNYVDDTKAEFELVDNYSDMYLSFYMLNEWYDDDVYSNQYVDPNNWKTSQVKALQDKINTLEIIESVDWFVPYSMVGTDAEFLVGDSDTMINEACAKIVTGEWGEDEWNATVQQAWESEGKIYSSVWTTQYHGFVG